MESVPTLDCAGRRRSPAKLASFHQGLSPRDEGLRYPPDPPTVEEASPSSTRPAPIPTGSDYVA